MTRRGQGQGAGSIWTWEGPVLDQAVAADYLLTKLHRTDVVVYGLWVSGFDIAPDVVKANWLKCIERDEQSRRREVARSKRDFYGLGKSQWREVLREYETVSLRQFVLRLVVGAKHQHGSSPESIYWQRLSEAIADAYPLPESIAIAPGDPIDAFMSEFMGAFAAWTFGDEEHDSDEIRCLIAEGVQRLEAHSGLRPTDSESYGLADGFWKKTGYETIFETESSKTFVASLNEAEIARASTAMTQAREIAEHFRELRDGPTDKVEAIQRQIAVMESVGPYWSKVLISLSRNQPNWPIWKTVSTLHAFAMSVKSGDLLTQNNSGPLFSEQFHDKWKRCKEEISKLWIPVMPQQPTP